MYWNVGNSKSRMTQVLEGSSTYDIIAIQEPSRSGDTGAPRCRRGGKYEMIYHSGRAALFVSKRIARDSWTMDSGKDWAAATFGNGPAARRCGISSGGPVSAAIKGPNHRPYQR